MTLGQRSYRKTQISNPENTPGTAEVATEILRGILTQYYEDKIFHQPNQDRGILATRIETPFQVQKSIPLEMSGVLYDRLAVFMMANAIRGNVTPTQPDAINQPNHYLWTFAPSLTSANTPDQANGIDTFTLEYGDNIQAYEVSYLFTSELVISGAVDEPVQFSWNIQGQQITETTFTPALTLIQAAPFSSNKTTYSINNSFATIGNTPKTSLLQSFVWTLKTMFEPRFSPGNLYFSGLNEGRKSATLELTYFRDDTDSEAEKLQFDNQTRFFPRIHLESDTEMDVGQNDPEYINIDGCYRYTDWPEVEDDNDLGIITVTAEAFYDITSTKLFQVEIGTKMSAFS